MHIKEPFRLKTAGQGARSSLSACPQLTMQYRILLVEDEAPLRDLIRLNLEAEGWETITAKDGPEAIRMFNRQRFSLLILDVMLPQMDGFEVCRNIRLTDKKIPVLFLTAKDNSADKIEGLKSGADDYMTKPFNLEEFLLRVKVLLRRSEPPDGNNTELSVYRFGEHIINFDTYEAAVRGQTIALTRKEVLLLRLLTSREGEVVSREQILQHVWGYDIYPSTRTIDNFIASFRKYFEKDPRNPMFFHSIRGVGYKFTSVER